MGTKRPSRNVSSPPLPERVCGDKAPPPERACSAGTKRPSRNVVSGRAAVAFFCPTSRRIFAFVEKLTNVRADRTLSRCGMWATGPRELTLPIEARGLSEVVLASGSLQLTPDYDVLAWLCERWGQRPTPSGVMRPTLYEIGSDLYEGPPSGKDYRTLRQSVWRLAGITVEIAGIDALTGEPGDYETRGKLLSIARPRREQPAGTDRLSVELDGWLRRAIDDGAPVRLSWRTLRAFHRNEQLAKRLWIYLAAERWKPAGGRDREGTWIACGDRLFAALGMAEGGRPRKRRESLKVACATIRRRDPRYAAGTLEVRKVGHSWRIDAERPSWDAWRAERAEHERVRRAIRESLV